MIVGCRFIPDPQVQIMWDRMRTVVQVLKIPCNELKCNVEWKILIDSNERYYAGSIDILRHCSHNGYHVLFWQYRKGALCFDCDCVQWICGRCMINGLHDKYTDWWMSYVKNVFKKRIEKNTFFFGDKNRYIRINN